MPYPPRRPICGTCDRRAEVIQHLYDEVGWSLSCYNCDKPSPDYYVDLDRIFSASLALGWLMHLRPKTWFTDDEEWPFLRCVEAIGLVNRSI